MIDTDDLRVYAATVCNADEDNTFDIRFFRGLAETLVTAAETIDELQAEIEDLEATIYYFQDRG